MIDISLKESYFLIIFSDEMNPIMNRMDVVSG